MKFNFLLLLVLSIFFFSGCDKNKEDDTVKKDTDTKIAKKVLLDINESISFTTLYDDNLTLIKTEDGFKAKDSNKTILLTFFTPSCDPCKAQIPHLNILQERYMNDLLIITILLDNNKPLSEPKLFVEENSVKYPVIYDNNISKFLNEFEEIKSLPLMIIYDREGNFVTDYQGAIPEEMIEADLKRVI